MAASAPQSQSQSKPLSAEEEALKSNTDCVYFLASPLTCKKGSECEYRHSDVARVNPRDCYYWLHGNCLNPKCAFRHPPLDGLLGAQTPTSTVPLPQSVVPPTPNVPNATTKQQGIPCVFFQKGYCLKGDWCQFLHAPISSTTKPLPVSGTAFEPVNVKKHVAAAYDKSVPQNVVPITAAKSDIKDNPVAKPPVLREFAPLRNEFAMHWKAPQTSDISEFSGYRSAPPHISNGNPVSWPSRSRQLEDPESMTSKDTAEEVSREHSPGFDVLVDDDGRDSGFYADEDRFRMSREHGPEYGIDHQNDDYSVIAGVDDERYNDRLGFDPHELREVQYDWEQHRASSYPERRPYSRFDTVGQVDESDLRHHLVKHKKQDGLRSIISREHPNDMPVGDRSYQGSRREEHHMSSREHSVGSRLRGRIGFPQRSMSPNNRDIIRSNDHRRTSIPSHQVRIHDRIKGRVDEAFNDSGKSYRGRHSIVDNNTDFAAPKSLAELKSRKNADYSTDQQSLGKRKHLTVDGHQESVNFEGPKPLDEILKRKKRIDTVEDKNEEKIVTFEDTKTDEKPNREGGVHGEDGAEQVYEHGVSDFEQLGGEDYELYEGENGEAEGEYIEEGEEEDDDDFAKKMGVVYS